VLSVPSSDGGADGGRATCFLLGTFYAWMVAAGLAVELIFGLAGLTPTMRNARVVEAHVSWNYTAVLYIVLLVLAAILLVRFLRTGGVAMLRAMNTHDDPGIGYVCPMHPDVVRPGPGRCPRCGMELVPAGH